MWVAEVHPPRRVGVRRHRDHSGRCASRKPVEEEVGEQERATWLSAKVRSSPSAVTCRVFKNPPLLTNSVHRLVDGALHEDLVADEEDAAATSHAILDAVSAVRTAAPLSK